MLRIALSLLLLGLSPGSYAESELHDSDFVAAFGSFQGSRQDLVKGSRVWRRNVRTFIVTNESSDISLQGLNLFGRIFLETYAHYPDEQPREDGSRHAQRVGDVRQALAPFLAHQHFARAGQGGYKWMLYGDDDTMFFLPNTKKLLRDFDHRIPLAITDNLWYRERPDLMHPSHPCTAAPRCTYCRPPASSSAASSPSSSSSSLPLAETEGSLQGFSYTPPRTCEKCSVDMACGPYKRANAACNKPIAHGGAGIIFSSALLEMISLEMIETCISKIWAPWGVGGSDTLISDCLWEAGVAFTDPGAWVERKHDEHRVLFDNRKMPVYRLALDMLSQGRCNAKCAWLLENQVSLHVAARSFPSPEITGLMMGRYLQTREMALELLLKNGGAQTQKA